MSRNAFDQIERDAIRDDELRDIGKAERCTVDSNSYALSMSDLQDLADALTLFDGNTRSQSDKDLISRCHQHIQTALGSDVGAVYQTDDEL